FDRILGLNFKSFTRGKIDEKQAELIKERDKARKEKQFSIADTIRDKLAEKGIVIEDTPFGTKWKKV
ncbi:MAG: cysteine--tRNA ligase, partial [Sulfurihydrogenibium azorense]